MSQPATCRACGDEGYEDGSDVCPGLCPHCFDQEMRRVTRLFDRAVKRDGLGVGIQEAHAAMVGFGMRPEAATDFLTAAMRGAS